MKTDAKAASARAASKRYYYRNHAESVARSATWRANPENRKRALEKQRDYKLRNKEAIRAAQKRWLARNRARKTAQQNERRGRKLFATPMWSVDFFVRECYSLAELRTKMFGFRWHVDHIVPLRSSKVCGLHAHTNLAVIPAAQNASKGNRRWPDMPELHA